VDRYKFGIEFRRTSVTVVVCPPFPPFTVVVMVTVEGTPSVKKEKEVAVLVGETSFTASLLLFGAATALVAKSTARRALEKYILKTLNQGNECGVDVNEYGAL